jgi:aspartate-semialdehyde dehydrogenase
MEKSNRIAVVGATGLVGRNILEVMEQRDFPFDELTLFASARSAGEKIMFKGKKYVVQELTREAFCARTDIALASAGRKVSYLLRDWLEGTEIVVVDNSSAFRMHDSVPLVVPEVNGEVVKNHGGYIANPNCSTIQLVMALKPIHDAFGLRRVVVSTYQSVSGAGQAGIDELSGQTVAMFNHQEYGNTVFPHRIAFNAIPRIGPFGFEGYTEEELKATNETRKILDLPDLGLSCTCVRISTFACHAESVMVETLSEPSVAELREAIGAFPGVKVIDDPRDEKYPVPSMAMGIDDVLVGRIRKDISAPHSYHLWVVADNILKGAALNTVQIAELL